MATQTAPENWAFFEKDLNRTDQRREWRYYRGHRSASDGFDSSDPTSSPVGEAACREFLEQDGALIADYRAARGRRKQRLRNRILDRLKSAGFISSRERDRWRDHAPCHWPAVLAAAA